MKTSIKYVKTRYTKSNSQTFSVKK